MIEIQRSLVDLVLFSRSSMGETRTSLVSTEPREEKGIPLSQRTGSPSARSRFPVLLYPFPSFLPCTSQPPASSRMDRPPHGIPHFLYLPAFLTTPRFAPVAGCTRGTDESSRPAAAQTRQIARPIFFYRPTRSTLISSIFRMLNST